MPIQTRRGVLIETDSFKQWGADVSVDFVVPLELVTTWRRCGLLSDFLSQYHSLHFSDPKKAYNILSTVVNELLENAVKFSNDKRRLVNLSLRRSDTTIAIETVNTTDQKQATKLNNFVATLETFQPEDLFFDRLNEASSSDDALSGLGLLGVMKDYGARLGVQISPSIDESSTFEVTILITLDTETINAI